MNIEERHALYCDVYNDAMDIDEWAHMTGSFGERVALDTLDMRMYPDGITSISASVEGCSNIIWCGTHTKLRDLELLRLGEVEVIIPDEIASIAELYLEALVMKKFSGGGSEKTIQDMILDVKSDSPITVVGEYPVLETLVINSDGKVLNLTIIAPKLGCMEICTQGDSLVIPEGCASVGDLYITMSSVEGGISLPNGLVEMDRLSFNIKEGDFEVPEVRVIDTLRISYRGEGELTIPEVFSNHLSTLSVSAEKASLVRLPKEMTDITDLRINCSGDLCIPKTIDRLTVLDVRCDNVEIECDPQYLDTLCVNALTLAIDKSVDMVRLRNITVSESCDAELELPKYMTHLRYVSIGSNTSGSLRKLKLEKIDPHNLT